MIKLFKNLIGLYYKKDKKEKTQYRAILLNIGEPTDIPKENKQPEKPLIAYTKASLGYTNYRYGLFYED